MLRATTTAAARKAIRDDGRRRLSHHPRNNGLLLSSLKDRKGLPLANERMLAVLRASLSHSTRSRIIGNGIGSRRKDDDSSCALSFSGRLPVYSFSPTTEIEGHSFDSSQHHSDFGLSLQSTTTRSRLLQNRRNASYNWESKIRFYPQYESRVFLSSSSSDKAENTRQRNPGYGTQAKFPIPKSSPTLSTSSNPLAFIDVKAIAKGTYDMTLSLTKGLFRIIIHLPGNMVFFATHPKERREKIAGLKESIKKEVDHYWVGIKVSSITESRLEIQTHLLI